MFITLADIHGKGFGDTDKKQAMMLNSIGKDVVRGIPAVSDKKDFLICSVSVEEVGESSLFVHFVDGLEYFVDEDIIEDVIEGIEMDLVDPSAALNVFYKAILVVGIVGEIQPGSVNGEEAKTVELL